MLFELRLVWETFGEIISALPVDIVTVVCTVFCYIGIVGVVRSL